MVNELLTNMLRKSMGKEQFFPQIVLGQQEIHMKNDEVDPCLTLYIKNNSKWIRDLKI